MQIKKKSTIESLLLDESSVDSLYPINVEGESSIIESDRQVLANIIQLFKDDVKNSTEPFRCFIEKKAYDAFIAFADEAYKKSRNEATGIIMGYYLHDKENPEKKIVIATNFLQANGPATCVACSISYDDYIRYDDFCIAHKMQQIVWIHSHPGYGVFYSGTDSAMLSSCFYANHQVGVVVDNLHRDVMGFKIKEGKETKENIYCFNMESSLRNKALQFFPLYEQEQDTFYPENQDDQFKKKEEDLTKTSIVNDSLDSHHIISVLERDITDLKVVIKQMQSTISVLAKCCAGDKPYQVQQFLWKDFFSIRHRLYLREIIFMLATISLSIILAISNNSSDSKCQSAEVEEQHVAQPVKEQKVKP